MKNQPKRRHFSFFPIRWMLMFYDCVVFTSVIAFCLILYKPDYISWLDVLWHYLICGTCIIFSRFFWSVYGQIYRYGGVQAYIRVMFADTCAMIAYYLLQRGIFGDNYIRFIVVALIIFTNSLVALSIRMVYRYIYKSLDRSTKFGRFVVKAINLFCRSDWSLNKGDPVSKVRIAIIGAGTTGTGLAEELLNNAQSTYTPVCFVDNDPEKLGRRIFGKDVIFEDKTAPEILKDYDVQEVVLALPSEVTSETRRDLYERYKAAGFKVKSYDYPSMQSTSNGKRTLRDFDIEDLLFRKEQEVVTEQTINYYKDKTILITGGGGSIGSEIARQLAKMSPKQLILLDIYENGVYDVQQELKFQYKNDLDLRVEICSVTNRNALEKVFKEYKPNIVIMAAAHKHVPLMEHNIVEAVDNNVFGTLNTVELAEKYEADRVHMVSTDKAVNPTNVMGATKRMCEMICMTHASKKQHTTFSATRFGNVLGSAGSVIPLFKRQIQNGGPVTLTDKRIIRYFMTIPEASQLVLHSAVIAKNGELMVLDMGQPVKIYDLAVSIIKMSGYEPDKDIEIVETGLRPGEKLYEELLVKDERLTKTENKLIFIEKDTPLEEKELQEKLDKLNKAMKKEDDALMKEVLKECVPTYVNGDVINDRVAKEEKKN